MVDTIIESSGLKPTNGYHIYNWKKFSFGIIRISILRFPSFSIPSTYGFSFENHLYSSQLRLNQGFQCLYIRFHQVGSDFFLAVLSPWCWANPLRIAAIKLSSTAIISLGASCNPWPVCPHKQLLELPFTSPELSAPWRMISEFHAPFLKGVSIELAEWA